MDDQEDPLTEEQYAALPWCHVYAQYVWHSEAQIWGTRAALTAIRDAIDKALTTGMTAGTGSLYTTDGEGYAIQVAVRDRKYLEGRDLPYTAPFAGGVGTRMFESETESNRKMAEQIAAHNAARKKAR